MKKLSAIPPGALLRLTPLSYVGTVIPIKGKWPPTTEQVRWERVFGVPDENIVMYLGPSPISGYIRVLWGSQEYIVSSVYTMSNVLLVVSSLSLSLNSNKRK